MIMSSTPTLDSLYKGLIETKDKNQDPDYILMTKEVADLLELEVGSRITDSTILYGMKVRVNSYVESVVYYDSTSTLDHLKALRDKMCSTEVDHIIFPRSLYKGIQCLEYNELLKL